MKIKKLKNKDITIVNDSIKRIYKSIFDLSTPLLLEHYWSIYAELCSRNDFNSDDDLKVSYEIIKEELIKRGVKVV